MACREAPAARARPYCKAWAIRSSASRELNRVPAHAHADEARMKTARTSSRVPARRAPPREFAGRPRASSACPAARRRCTCRPRPGRQRECRVIRAGCRSRASMPSRQRSRMVSTRPSPFVSAASAPSWIGPDVPLFMSWVICATWGATDAGCVSQPTRQPVIAQLFEKLLIASARSSGSACARIEGAHARALEVEPVVDLVRDDPDAALAAEVEKRLESRRGCSTQPVGLAGVENTMARVRASQRANSLSRSSRQSLSTKSSATGRGSAPTRWITLRMFGHCGST